MIMFVVSMWLNTIHMSFPAIYRHAVSRVNTALCGPPVTALTPYFEFYCSSLEVARTAAPPSTLFPESSLFDPSKSNFSVFAPVFSGCSVNCTVDDFDSLELVQVDAQFVHSSSELIVAPKFELSVVSAPESSLPVCLPTEVPVRPTMEEPVHPTMEESVRPTMEEPVRPIVVPWYIVLPVEWIIYFFLVVVYYNIFFWVFSRIAALKRRLLDDAKQPQAVPQAQPAAPPAAEGRRRRRRRNNNNNNGSNN